MNTQVESSPTSSIFTFAKKDDVHDLDRRLPIPSRHAGVSRMDFFSGGFGESEYNQA